MRAAEQRVELGLDLGGRHDEQLVAALERRVRRGHDDAPFAQDRDERAVLRPRHLPDQRADLRCVVGERDLDEVRLALLQGEQPDEVADGDRLLDDGGQQPGRGDRDVDAPGLVEQPLVLRVVDAGDDAVDAELGLAEQGDDEVDLVVAGGRDDGTFRDTVVFSVLADEWPRVKAGLQARLA